MAADDSAKQEKALAALLSEKTIEAAALKAGISESTLIRWLKEPDFQKPYREARKQIVTHAVTQLQVAAVDAVNALREIATCLMAKDTARVAASCAILDRSMKAVEEETRRNEIWDF